VLLLLPVSPGVAATEERPLLRSATGPRSPAFSQSRSFRHVRQLAGRIGPRPAGSPAYQRAVRYVERVLGRYGYVTTQVAFDVPGVGRSWNVMASWPGGGEATVVIGAHLDTVPGSPGGNDNASGVATLLETARVLARAGEAEGLELVAFGAEERQPSGGHHYGSQAYVDALGAKERQDLDLMVSVDMIGKVRRYIAGWLGTGPRSAVRRLSKAVRAAGYKVDVRAVGDVSDHGPFALANIPAAVLWTGLEPHWHSPGDVVGNVAPKSLTRGGAVLAELLARV
jgi:hypothetical protein